VKKGMAFSSIQPLAERPASDRVVITGMGVVAPPGNDVPTFWKALTEGRSSARLIDRFDTTRMPCKFACHVDNFDPTQWVDKKAARRYDRFVQFAVAASLMALSDASLELAGEDADRCGVLIGSGIGGMKTYEDECEVILTQGPTRVSPFFVPMMISNMAAGIVSIITGARGPNLGVVSACSTGAHAIGEAAWMIRRGDARIMVAGGSEAAITPLSVAGFSAAKALSTRNDDPQHASRPFDRCRDGFVMGEGAGVVIIEALDHALERGAPIYAELAGYGLSADAHHITAPPEDGSGAVRAMQAAIAQAAIQPSDVDYINAHGTSTQANDRAETAAIKRVFGDHARTLAISSTKSVTGHLLGAAGGVEAIATALAIVNRLLPPTINQECPDPECDLDYVPNVARPVEKLDVAMSNSFGFGGQNASLLLSRYMG
jgi:3-oxoacyl-[acyl-carrier-protein] synthase II